MNTLNRQTIFALLFMLWAPSAQAEVSVEGYYWFMQPKGEIWYSGVRLPGTRLDLERDLGYEDAEAVPGARILAGTPTHQLEFDYFGIDIDSSHQARRGVRLLGFDFGTTEQIDSEVESDFLRLLYRFAVGNEQFRGGLSIGGQYVSLYEAARSPRAGDQELDIDIGAPIFGGFFRAIPHPNVEFGADLVGVSWDASGVDITVYDMSLAAHFIMRPGVTAGVGYRKVAVEGEDTDDNIRFDLSFTGPVIFLGGAF